MRDGDGESHEWIADNIHGSLSEKLAVRDRRRKGGRIRGGRGRGGSRNEGELGRGGGAESFYEVISIVQVEIERVLHVQLYG